MKNILLVSLLVSLQHINSPVMVSHVVSQLVNPHGESRAVFHDLSDWHLMVNDETAFSDDHKRLNYITPFYPFRNKSSNETFVPRRRRRSSSVVVLVRRL